MKMLINMQPAKESGYECEELKECYFKGSLDKEWQETNIDDSVFSMEIKRYEYYTFDKDIVLQLFSKNKAYNLRIVNGSKIEYHFTIINKY